MAQVKKCFGDLPENVVVLSEVISFDKDGYGEASPEAANVLADVPGYEVVLESAEFTEDPPAEDPPAEDPPAEDPPVEDLPAEVPPAEVPPAEVLQTAQRQRTRRTAGAK